MKQYTDFLFEERVKVKIESGSEEFVSDLKLGLFESDAPSNVASGDAVASPDAAPLFRTSKFAGCDCVEVDSDTYSKCKFGKKPYARWDGYIEDENLRTFVRKHYSTKKHLLVSNKDTGAMTYLKRQ